MAEPNNKVEGAVMLLAAVAIIAWFVWPSAPADTAPPAPSFRQIGYFKSQANDRIWTFEMRGDPDVAEVHMHARQQPHTSGQMTAIYYYPPGSTIPADGVTRGRDVFQISRVIYETPGLSPWRYAFMRDRQGGARFVDCLEQPDAEFCRAP